MEGKQPDGRKCPYCSSPLIDNFCSIPDCRFNYLKELPLLEPEERREIEPRVGESNRESENTYDWLKEWSDSDLDWLASPPAQESGDNAQEQEKSNQEKPLKDEEGSVRTEESVPAVAEESPSTSHASEMRKSRNKTRSERKSTSPTMSVQPTTSKNEIASRKCPTNPSAAVVIVKLPKCTIISTVSCVICEIQVADLSAHQDLDSHRGCTKLLDVKRDVAIVPDGANSKEFDKCKMLECSRVFYRYRANEMKHYCHLPAGARILNPVMSKGAYPRRKLYFCLMCELRYIYLHRITGQTLNYHWIGAHENSSGYVKVIIRGIETLIPKGINIELALQFCSKFCQVFNFKNRKPLVCGINH